MVKQCFFSPYGIVKAKAYVVTHNTHVCLLRLLILCPDRPPCPCASDMHMNSEVVACDSPHNRTDEAGPRYRDSKGLS